MTAVSSSNMTSLLARVKTNMLKESVHTGNNHSLKQVFFFTTRRANEMYRENWMDRIVPKKHPKRYERSTAMKTKQLLVNLS